MIARIKRAFGGKAKPAPPTDGMTVQYPVAPECGDGHPQGIYIGDGIYLRGSDEPAPYPPSVHFGGVQH